MGDKDEVNGYDVFNEEIVTITDTEEDDSDDD